MVSIQESIAQSIRIYTQIDGFRHNFECNNDATTISQNKPDPRYKVWVGYDGGNYSQYTNGPGLYPGCSGASTYGRDEATCSYWNPGIINGPLLTGNATTLNVDMESWEEDGCGSECTSNSCTFNSDDVRCSRRNIGDINLMANPPCVDRTYTGGYTSSSFLSMRARCQDHGGYYGIHKLNVRWEFVGAPSIPKQPNHVDFGGPDREVCTGFPMTLTVHSNAKQSWTLARWVKWQVSSNGSTGWQDVAGTVNSTAHTTQTSFDYTFTPNTPGTYYYRAVLSSNCGRNFSSQTNYSSNVRVVVRNRNTDPFCTAPACDIAYVDPTKTTNVGANGTPANPYKYISSAVNTGALYVRVAGGIGTEPEIVHLTHNVVIEGGYRRYGSSGENWVKSSRSADRTIITFSGSESISGVRHVVAFKSVSKIGWTVKDLDIITANAPGFNDANNRGMSNYGFLIINSMVYRMSRLHPYCSR